MAWSCERVNAPRSDADWVSSRDRFPGRVVKRRWSSRWHRGPGRNTAVIGRGWDPDPRSQRACPRSLGSLATGQILCGEVLDHVRSRGFACFDEGGELLLVLGTRNKTPSGDIRISFQRQLQQGKRTSILFERLGVLQH